MCRFVEDACAYLTGLVSPAEVLPLARAARDRMLARVVLDGLQRQLAGLGPRDLGRAMQACAENLIVTLHAHPALCDPLLCPRPMLTPLAFTGRQHCCMPARLG
jgi:hypothetical protein